MSNALIIIPTYNEIENIEDLIRSIFCYAPDVRLLIVDDDSTDGTAEITDSMAKKDPRVSVLHRKENRGRGYAGVDAFKKALEDKNIEYIIEMDGDFSHDPAYIPRFLREAKENDIIIGSRYAQGGKDEERDLIRNILSKASNFFIRKYLGFNILDCSSGYRSFKRKALASIGLDSLISKGPAIIEEILYISRLRGFSVKEIPIVFRQRRKGKTKLNLIKLMMVFRDILIFKNIHSQTIVDAKLKQELRSFGYSFGLGLNILGAIMFYRGKGHFIWFTFIGSSIFIFAILFPKVLKLIKFIMGRLIVLIGQAMAVLTMLLAFFLLFTPIGIILRIFGKDLLNRKIDKSATSYWIAAHKKHFSKEHYERMG